MTISLPLSRREQLTLNARALVRDLSRRDLRKACFHLRGFCRALIVPW
jgi:hypothetical protein